MNTLHLQSNHTHSHRASPLRASSIWLAGALLLGASGALHAQSDNTSPTWMPTISFAGNSYIGLSGGPSDFARNSAGVGNFARDKHSTAYSLAAGNYFAGQNYGVEVAYTDFGRVSRAGGKTKAEGISLSLIGRLPINERLNLLGRVGGIYARTGVSSDPTSGVAAGSESGFDWAYGVGAELVINPQWSGVLQYSENHMKFAGNASERVSATTIGVRLKF